MIGDGADPSHIHESRDGREWVRHEHDARWGAAYGGAHASYRGALWRAGGFVDSAGQRVLHNDVWRSRDGRHWELLLTRAPWPPRARAHLVPFRDTLWLIGGDPGDQRVWFTLDGLVWGSRPVALPSQNPQGLLVHGNALWILGHGMWENATNDIWSSPDGVDWTRRVATAPWPARTGAGFGVLGGRMWVIAGAGRRDVWSSLDGVQWGHGLGAAPWSAQSRRPSGRLSGWSVDLRRQNRRGGRHGLLGRRLVPEVSPGSTQADRGLPRLSPGLPVGGSAHLVQGTTDPTEPASGRP